MKFVELRDEYQSSRGVLDAFLGALRNEIAQLLAQADIPLGVPIESRVKTWSSLSSKLKRGGPQVLSVLDVPDLVGVRLILLFRRDVSRVVELLSQELDVTAVEDAAERLGESSFGYQSIHLSLQLPESWLKVPTMSDFSGLAAEVQVRTLAQHSWAAVSHKLQYKQEESVPAPVRRAIHRVSALLETVDLEFERVLEARDSYVGSIDAQDRDEGLNVDIVEQLLDALLPAENKDERGVEDYASLLQDLDHFSIQTVGQLRAIIDEHLATAREEDATMAAAIGGDASYLDAPDLDRLKRGVYFTHVGLARGCLEAAVGDEWAQYKRKRLRRNVDEGDG